MKLSDYVRLLVLAALWGASFLFMRISAPVLGAVGLAVILALLKTQVDFNGKLKKIMVLGVINATTPMMGVIIGWLCFSDSLTLKKGAGVLIGLMGITVLTSTSPVTLSMSILMGALACLVATSCYGAVGFLTKRWIADKGGLDSKLVAFGSQIGATLFLAPAFGISAAMSPPATWGNPEVWMALVAIGFFCTACAYILCLRLVADIGPVRSLTVTFLVPPFGVM